MSQWIELNLPYSFYEGFDIKLKAPNLNKRAKKELGFDSKDVATLFDALPSISDKSEAYSEMYELADKLDDEAKKKFPSDRDLYNQERIKLYAKSKNANVRAMSAYLEKKWALRKWEDVQPELTQYYTEYQRLYQAALAEQNKQSFSGLGLDKPGTLIEVEVDSVLSQYLIGDINPNAGVCDDCVEFDKRTAIVKRYQIVWSKEGK